MRLRTLLSDDASVVPDPNGRPAWEPEPSEFASLEYGLDTNFLDLFQLWVQLSSSSWILLIALRKLVKLRGGRISDDGSPELGYHGAGIFLVVRYWSTDEIGRAHV